MKLKKQLLTLLLMVGMVFSLPITTLAASADTTVYVTKTGEKYHNNGCQYLRKSQIAISLQDAVTSGYDACSRCNPPILTASEPIPAPTPIPQTPAPQPTTVSAPVPAPQQTTSDPVSQAMMDQFTLYGTIHGVYKAQFNTLMQTRPSCY